MASSFSFCNLRRAISSCQDGIVSSLIGTCLDGLGRGLGAGLAGDYKRK